MDRGKPFISENKCASSPKKAKIVNYTEVINSYSNADLNYFSIYNSNRELIAFDTKIKENDFYFDGYVIPIIQTKCGKGSYQKHVGPIYEWNIEGYDSNSTQVVLSTAFSKYYLGKSSQEYGEIMEDISKRIYLAKVIIRYLIDEESTNKQLGYKNLLEAVHGANFAEEFLLNNINFVLEEVEKFCSTNLNNNNTHWVFSSPSFQVLCKLGHPYSKFETPEYYGKATTTKLVCEIFDSFFKNQIEKQTIGTNKKQKTNVRLCGVCESCQTPDCGKCYNCRNMVKFGGTSTSNEITTLCEERKCTEMNIAIEEPRVLRYKNRNKRKETMYYSSKKLNKEKVIWIGEAVFQNKGRNYFSAAKVGNVTVQPNDNVMITANIKSKALLIAKIINMWQDVKGRKLFHANLFLRASDTVLGETADPNELFVIDSCTDFCLNRIFCHAEVYYKDVARKWASSKHQNKQLFQADGTSFYYSQKYNIKCGRFEQVTEILKNHLVNIEETSHDKSFEDELKCEICKSKEANGKIKIRYDGDIYFQNEVYSISSGIYLEPYHFKYIYSAFQEFDVNDSDSDESERDENLYTEFYRKVMDNNNDTDIAKPFSIAIIEEIIYNELPKNTKLKVRHFCRPEHTHKTKLVTYEKDLNLVYWTSNVSTITIDEIRGQCYLACDESLTTTPNEWTKKGPHRFYFKDGYDLKKREIISLPLSAKEIGLEKTTGLESIFPTWKKLDKPLKCLDIFAGCGGFSEGLEQVGLSETKWAIENDVIVAHAFELNHKNATVIAKDCNEVLSMIMANKDSARKLNLPRREDVELIIGGPPCQGFSGMNRFNDGEYSMFRNSLIATFLSYCDYYKPNYFIFENVRNFVSFKKGIVFKLTLRCMLAIGYQVAFGVLQSANYGVPQSRHRLIIVGAAPGYPLPHFPEPVTVYKKRELAITLNGIRCSNGINWQTSAPFRTITVRDAISDLPKIKNGNLEVVKCYNCAPFSHFQRSMRSNHTPKGIVSDHICKEVGQLAVARMEHIPSGSGVDWRNLPNIRVKLNNGLYTNKLIYKYRFKYQKKADPPRAVCKCALGQNCDLKDRQFNTLIPWSLPHTADRQNNWHAVYGRLDLDGVFGTTVTNPDPMGKQGKVLHPEQNRIISVRECARSQGFSDNYMFYGSVPDKHRQIGNAVPPPLASAIGQEIIKSIFDNQLH